MAVSHTESSIEKSEARGQHGMVATKHAAASAVGAEVLAAGGSAADAAVASAFAVGVVEPWNSGVGGGGYAVVSSAEATEVIGFPMRSGTGATAEKYPLDGRENVSGFLWNGVRDDANLHGYRAMAVPGAVAGLALLHQRHGEMPWKELVQPAVALARQGFELSWYDTAFMATMATAAQRHPELQQRYYPGGAPPMSDHFDAVRLTQPELGNSLEVIALDGPDSFYVGDIAAAVVSDSIANDGVIERADLADYRAQVGAPLHTTYRQATVLLPGPGCAGPTTAETLNIYERFDVSSHDHNSAERLHVFMNAARLAYADRFRFMTDPARADVPWEALVSKTYAGGRYDLIGPYALTDGVKPGDAWAYQDEAREGQRLKSETSTTHLCTADGRGGLVSLTNTLGGGWGSEVIPGNTGIVWNNGMYWFDPVPGRLTSVAPRRFGLNNMTPAIVFAPDGRALAVGASGGRRITNCVAQLVGNIVDHTLGAQEAINAPRVDASTPWVTVDGRFGDETISELQRRGWDVHTPPFPGRSAFASPTLILRDADGGFGGGVDVFHTAGAQGV